MRKAVVGLPYPASFPTVSVGVSEATSAEGSTIVITLTRSGGDLNLASQVRLYTLPISASYDDFTRYDGEFVTFNAGQTTTTRNVVITADSLTETSETFKVVIGNNRLCKIGANEQIITISDSGVVLPPATRTVTGVAGSTVTEGSNLVFTVSLSGVTEQSQTFSYALSGTASGADYNTPPTFSNGVTLGGLNVTVPIGVSTFTVTYATVDDGLIESSETLTLTIGGVAGVGTINDNDAPATRTVQTVSSPIVTEGQTISFTVLLSGATEQVQNFAFTVGGTATGGTDYATPLTLSNSVTISGGNFVVPVGVTSFTASTLTSDDILSESTETVILTVGGVSGTASIIDNDTVAPSNAVELWGNDYVFTKYSGNSQGVINLFHGVAINDRTYLDPLTRVPTDIPVGQSVVCTIFTDKKANGYIRPGTYYIVADKPINITVGGSGAGYTATSGGVGVGSFTVLPSASGIYNPSTGYGNLNMTLQGTSGVTGAVFVEIYHQDDANYRSRGFISTPRWIEQNAHLYLRYMDALSTNRQYIQLASQMLPEKSLQWDNNNGVDWARYVPLSVIAKREIELYHVTGKMRKVHINLPTGNFHFNVDAVDPVTNKITTISGVSAASNAQHFTDGQPVHVRPYGTMPTGLTEGQYFLRWVGNQLSLSTTADGGDIDFTSSGSFFLFSDRDPAAIMLAYMTELYNITHTVDGTTYNFRDVVSKLVIETGNEPWNNGSAFKTSYICRTVGSWRGVGAYDNFAEGLKYFSLKGWKAAQLAGWPDSKIERTINCQVSSPNSVLPILNLTDSAGILSSGTAIKDIPNISVAIAPYYNVGNPALQTSMNMIQWVADGALTESDTVWRDNWLYGMQRSGAGTKIFCDTARGYKSDIRIISYEGGSHDDFFFTTDEFAGKYAFGVRMNNFLHDTPEGVQVHQAYYDATYVANKVMTYNQYYTHDYYTMPRERFVSTTSQAISLGTKTFAYSTFINSVNVGDQIEIRSQANPVNAMSGNITEINAGVSVTVNVTKISGSGTHSDWVAGTTQISTWGMTDNIHRPDNDIMTWWKTLVPYGIDTGVISTVGTPADTAEGATMVFPVTSTGTGIRRVEWSVTAESASDIGTPTASNGVTLSGSVMTIPDGVTTFNVNVPIADDATTEFDEPVILTVDGVSAEGTILFNDGAEGGSPDFAHIFDLQIGGAGNLAVTQGANREEVLFTYNISGSQFGTYFHLAQPNKAGTPMILPEIPDGAIVRIEYLMKVDVAGFTPNFQFFTVNANGWQSRVFLTLISGNNTVNIGAGYGTVKASHRWQNNTGAAIPTTTQVGMYLRHNSATVINAAIKDFVAYIE